jgi:hypothetical protein
MPDNDIDERVLWQPVTPVQTSALFLQSVEQEHLKEEIAKTLSERIPRLWALEHEDSNGTDLPDALFALMDALETDCCIEFRDGD